MLVPQICTIHFIVVHFIVNLWSFWIVYKHSSLAFTITKISTKTDLYTSH
jgi:hypothetical protein